MIKKSITFKNFDGVEVTKDYFFHYSKTDLFDMEAEYEHGLKQELERVMGGGNVQEILNFVKKFVLGAYGVRSAESDSFVKTPEASKLFEQSIAYEKLFMELAFNGTKLAEFLNGVIPQDLEATVTGILAEQGMTADDLMAHAAKVQAGEVPTTQWGAGVAQVTQSIPPVPQPGYTLPPQAQPGPPPPPLYTPPTQGA
jgi:hypothetical protein